MSTAKLKKDLIKELADDPHSLAELAQKMGLKEKRVFRLLRSLFEAGEIASLRGADGIRKYRVTTSEEKAKAPEDSAAKEGVEVDVDDEEDDE